MSNRPYGIEEVLGSAQTRWQDDRGISDLSIAIDEIYRLRAALAEESLILQSHLSYKTFPKSRRKYAEEQVERMQHLAAGDLTRGVREGISPKTSLRWAGADECLTNHQWAEQRGLKPVDRG